MTQRRLSEQFYAIVAVLLSLRPATSVRAQDLTVSAERGLRLSIVGGCHDCHTEGFTLAEGVVDPAKSLKGSGLGFQGPWGTTYAANLRLTAAGMSEDEFVTFAKSFKARPPMPWFNMRPMEDAELRSLYRYIVSLGDPGDPVPAYVESGKSPATPFIVLAPPRLPE